MEEQGSFDAGRTTESKTDALIRRAYLFLEDGEWDKANEYCERVLDLSPENPKAYLGKLMVEQKAHRAEDLQKCETPFDHSTNYKRAVQFGGQKLEAYLKHCNENAKGRYEKRAQQEQEKKKKARSKFRKAVLIVAPILIIGIAVLLVLTNVILPKLYHDSFIREYGDALASIKVGDSFSFGSYEQDNDLSNGKERIEWLVLDIQDGKALLVSKYALDSLRFNNERKDVITWETCSLRKWLNTEFLQEAFSPTERRMIQNSFVKAENKLSYGDAAINDTYDRIFLLSSSEAENYLDWWNMYSRYTDFAFSRGLTYSDFYGESGFSTCIWWLRDNYYSLSTASCVDLSGNISAASVNEIGIAVRPALWLNID